MAGFRRPETSQELCDFCVVGAAGSGRHGTRAGVLHTTPAPGAAAFGCRLGMIFVFPATGRLLQRGELLAPLRLIFERREGSA